LTVSVISCLENYPEVCQQSFYLAIYEIHSILNYLTFINQSLVSASPYLNPLKLCCYIVASESTSQHLVVIQSPSITQGIISVRSSFVYKVCVQDTEIIDGAKNGNVVSVHVMICYKESRDIPPPSVNLSTRLKLVLWSCTM